MPSTLATTTYHHAEVDGLRIFYREAGPVPRRASANFPTLSCICSMPGIFALDEEVDEIARLMIDFVERHRE
jgi:hypothetical protein